MNLAFRFAFFTTVLCIGALFARAQVSANRNKSVIAKQTIILHYNNPADSFRKPFDDTLNVPIADGSHPYLRDSLAAKVYFGDSFEELKAGFDTCGCGIMSMEYETTFETKKVVSLKLYYETMGAYPSGSQTWLTLDIATGSEYPLSNELNDAGLRWILKHYKNTLLNRIQAKRADLKKKYAEDSEAEYRQLLDGINDLSASDLFHFFVFTKKGIVLSMEQILPHYAAGSDPDRDVFIPYAKLKPYLAPGSIIVKSAK